MAIRGTASFVVLLAAMMVACEDGGPTAPTTITQDPITVEPTEVTITVVIPYPGDFVSIHGNGIPGVTVTCLSGCVGRQTEVTDNQGEVTLVGNTPLTVRAEKSGYIPAEQGVYVDSKVRLSNEWPTEAREAVRQLGLADAIASGAILLIWGDEEYFSGPGHGGEYACPIILVRKWRGRAFMVATLVHEAMHAWQGRQSTNPPCDTTRWAQSESGRAWIAATEQDLKEHGPIPGFDDSVYGLSGMLLSDIPLENQAMFYAVWYTGTNRRTPVTTAEFHRLSPNRTRYLEDRFGPSPR